MYLRGHRIAQGGMKEGSNPPIPTWSRFSWFCKTT